MARSRVRKRLRPLGKGLDGFGRFSIAFLVVATVANGFGEISVYREVGLNGFERVWIPCPLKGARAWVKPGEMHQRTR